MKSNDDLRDVRDHYASMAQYYVDRYEPDQFDSLPDYPAEYFRLELIRKRVVDCEGSRLLDAGVGSGIPIIKLAEQIQTKDVVAFDYTPEMVEFAKLQFEAAGLDPDKVNVGDINDANSFALSAADGHFDIALMLGVIPHVEDETMPLSNLRTAMKPGGRAFVSFRNKLFSAFTMNRYTHAFVLNELLKDVDESIRAVADAQLKSQLRMDMPPTRDVSSTGGVGYDLILARMHNPLEMRETFEAAGFADIRIHFYHYHPCFPYLEGDGVSPDEFRRAAMALEGEKSGWRGYFLCSAFVVEATA